MRSLVSFPCSIRRGSFCRPPLVYSALASPLEASGLVRTAALSPEGRGIKESLRQQERGHRSSLSLLGGRGPPFELKGKALRRGLKKSGWGAFMERGET